MVPVDELFSTVMSIVQIQERNKIRVFLRKDPYGRFCYCLAYVPRDIYSTEVRQKIQQVLMDRLKASDCEFWTFFSESVLARLHFVIRVPIGNGVPELDPVALEAVAASEEDAAASSRSIVSNRLRSLSARSIATTSLRTLDQLLIDLAIAHRFRPCP